MSEQRKEKGHGRRDVLKLASLGSVAAAAVSVVGAGEGGPPSSLAAAAVTA